ncbi:Proline dehydrogenase [Nitrosotalea devaniterrae]|uniref:proline dehydrogenase n=1 Tax=Nitrosotalea devaniterrae TaxID=1078905 RepID=A0A128A3S3_9ARCH|nr:Proline dehydrogenase [Candidatus Nitrosotalea devanaterra]
MSKDRLEKQESTLIEKVLFKIAKQWIAGDTMEDALKSARQANGNGMSAILNKLGEHMASKQKVNQTVSDYLTLVSSLRRSKIIGGLSIKPTQVGLAISAKECLGNLDTIIEKALQFQSFVWIDMESSEFTDDTFNIYKNLFEKYERVGIVIQANLKRTGKDLDTLLKQGAKIRLVKGAYHENSKNAYRTRHEVDENYRKLMNILFDQGNEFAIATHDSKLIDLAMELSKKHERKFEFQMLKGIRDELKPVLVKSGFTVSEYIPYGTNWLPYSIRRLRERKRNILLLGSSFIHSHRV